MGDGGVPWTETSRAGGVGGCEVWLHTRAGATGLCCFLVQRTPGVRPRAASGILWVEVTDAQSLSQQLSLMRRARWLCGGVDFFSPPSSRRGWRSEIQALQLLSVFCPGRWDPERRLWKFRPRRSPRSPLGLKAKRRRWRVVAAAAAVFGSRSQGEHCLRLCIFQTSVVSPPPRPER